MELNLWEYALSARSEAYLIHEIKKLKMSKVAIAKLERGMRRIQDSQTRGKEIGKVRGEVWELRIDVDARWYRLLWAKKGDRWVALLLVAKKRNDLHSDWIETAESRLSEHH